MKRIDTEINGVCIIESDCFGDNRGWFMETYNQAKFNELGIDASFVQDNLSYSQKKGVFRGFHFQKNPHCQAKLVRCIKGKVLDIVVDIRKGSPTYGKYVTCELSEENKRMFFGVFSIESISRASLLTSLPCGLFEPWSIDCSCSSDRFLNNA